MLKTILISGFLILGITGQSQCVFRNTTFATGESIEYEVYYNWGFVWLNAGWVRFQVKDTLFNKYDCYLLDSYGSSHNSYDWLYKVRDHYRSCLHKESLQPLYFHRKNYEGGYEVDDRYVFNWKKKEAYAYTQNSKKAFSIDTVTLPACTFDLLSLIYYARNVDFDNMKTGDKLPVITIIDTTVYNLYIRYLGREKITDRNGKEFACIKFSALLVEGTIFKGGEDMFVWVTDDANRIPVLVESKILVGSVKAYLSGTKGLRHPIKYF
ncbi:MAG: DUF3108 domain-containing protein [Bacteroidota bacterium]|nr:MAG: DUF3108 domain-containing protein [Bacteroidota bacterium]